jgi:hypothetical protein
MHILTGEPKFPMPDARSQQEEWVPLEGFDEY